MRVVSSFLRDLRDHPPSSSLRLSSPPSFILFRSLYQRTCHCNHEVHPRQHHCVLGLRRGLFPVVHGQVRFFYASLFAYHSCCIRAASTASGTKVRQIPIDSNSECSASDDVFNSGSATLQRLWEHISRRRGAAMFLLLNNRHTKIRTRADGIRNAPERKAEADSIIPIVVFCKNTRIPRTRYRRRNSLEAI